MNTKPVKKINIVYLLLVIAAPIAVIALGGLIGYYFFRDGGAGAVVCFMGPTLLSVAWWILGPTTIWNQQKKQMMKQLDDQGFNRNQTFYGSNQTVAVDIRQGKVALLLFWNPFEQYVMPASRITRAWTNDGAGGAGFMRGTSRVSFLFLIDGVRVRVNTFTSNQRWRMDDPKILEAISKADMMVQVLDAARQASGD
ncbi:MAG: hypothetical protein K2M42_07710 [Oscillospiraceae bacterium]|nr:hypothetical protein [Oscillospiraceae bacterium]